MYVGFQHPDYGIPCIGEWDQFTNELTFSIENESEAKQYNHHEELERTRNWCEWKSTNSLETIEQVNQYLSSLGIAERLQE